MGWPELLQALEAEAGREAQAVLARARAEADRVVAEAGGAAEGFLATVRAREAEASARARRAALARLEAERTRERLVEEHRLLEALRREALARALAEADEPLLARLIGEVLAWAPDGPLVLEVDPGDEAAARAVLAADHGDLLPRVAVEAAPARRGGVLLRAGPLTLDDTLPARLERAAAALAPDLARTLLEEEA